MNMYYEKAKGKSTVRVEWILQLAEYAPTGYVHNPVSFTRT